MSNIIFFHYREPGISIEEMNKAWSDETQVSIISRLPGITKYVENHVIKDETGVKCDGIGELWFESDKKLDSEINSPLWSEAVEDAKRYIDLEPSGAIIVREVNMN
ncbi:MULTISPECIES: EthD family reductase [Klebsiella/Raoultella group]|uniref:EthD family reductase n=1 Tax=Klebsiella/Raoultella group TaxID=2890311 RepID=UPI0015A7396C|nr:MULTISPECIES: EthD family reductase [Klebsiella/Raoultella group]QLK20883.1 EthD family reductase [Raoultella ornithinolytica]